MLNYERFLNERIAKVANDAIIKGMKNQTYTELKSHQDQVQFLLDESLIDKIIDDRYDTEIHRIKI